jgi:hypothetical protein
MQRKSIAKSIRMTSEVHDFVERREGKGFNEKFENLVIFFMREEKAMQKRLKEQQKTYEANQKRIEAQRKILGSLETISSSVSSLLNISKAAEGVQLKMQEKDVCVYDTYNCENCKYDDDSDEERCDECSFFDGHVYRYKLFETKESA